MSVKSPRSRPLPVAVRQGFAWPWGALFALLLMVGGCSDDGQDNTESTSAEADSVTNSGTTTVASEASTGSTVSGSSTSTAATGSGGTVGDVSSTSSAGGASATSGGGASEATTATGGAAGGSSSDGTQATSSTGGTGNCPEGQIWCPGCTPGSGICSAGGCPGVACPACTELTTLEECELTAGCHPVFEDPQVCGCAALGCCAQFLRCALGDTADCVGPASCDAPTPYCEGPPYVVAYSGSCYDGCVRAEDCAN